MRSVFQVMDLSARLEASLYSVAYTARLYIKSWKQIRRESMKIAKFCFTIKIVQGGHGQFLIPTLNPVLSSFEFSRRNIAISAILGAFFATIQFPAYCLYALYRREALFSKIFFKIFVLYNTKIMNSKKITNLKIANFDTLVFWHNFWF